MVLENLVGGVSMKPTPFSIDRLNTPSIRSVMGQKKRRLSRSGAASHAIIATNDGSSVNHAQSAEKDSPRLFRARHGAGEWVVSNLQLANH